MLYNAPLFDYLLTIAVQEGFSVDPYLCGILNADTVIGVQENAIVSAKHYIGNEQETNRNPTSTTGNASVSSNIDDRTMHELYLWPFQDVVKAGAGMTENLFVHLDTGRS